MTTKLEKKYQDITSRFNFRKCATTIKISTILKEILVSFIKKSSRPAIYCNGKHTKMLMSDYMNELREIKIIIDNGPKKGEQGFRLIRDCDIEKEKIDAIIISSYKFKNEIKQQLNKLHPTISYLDIYEELEKRGFNLNGEYYIQGHPYRSYENINEYQKKIDNRENIDDAYNRVIEEYIQIKDFKTAIDKTREWLSLGYSTRKNSLLKSLEQIYSAELDSIEKIDENNILLFCMDAMRKDAISSKYMPKLHKYVCERGFSFENMYSFSTSTFESLMPVYSENDDMSNPIGCLDSVPEEECRFIKEARKQGRSIYIYGDSAHYIEGDNFKYSETCQTITEKIWDFVVDAEKEKKSLFYIHELYETHFSFPNPYTKDKLLSIGTAMLFDFLPENGGRLKIDYNKQYKDSLKYIDDIFVPFLERMKFQVVLFADHGTILLDKDVDVKQVKDAEYTCSNQWIKIPFVVFSPIYGKGNNKEIISLMSFNNIILSILKKERFVFPDNQFIKIGRTRIYNPDFIYLYELANKKRYLQGFEAFIFKNKDKLVVYEDGSRSFFDKNDDIIKDDKREEALYSQIAGEVTIVKKNKIAIFGTGLFYEKRKNNLNKNEIIVFFDNDKNKQGKLLDGKKIISPSKITENSFDYIVIMSVYFNEIYNQLISLKINPQKILSYNDYLQKKIYNQIAFDSFIAPKEFTVLYEQLQEKLKVIGNNNLQINQLFKHEIERRIDEIKKTLNPKVSVIMPAYNGERFIAAAINSILNQTYNNFELIIVEDVSTDETYKEILQFNDPRIHVLRNNKNMGIGYTTNRGLKKSTGKYIALIDDDDIAMPERLEKQVEFLEGHPDIGLLGTRSMEIDENDNYLTYCDVPISNSRMIKANLLFNHINFTNASIMFRKDILTNNNIQIRDNCYGIQDFRFYIDCSKVCNLTSLDLPLIKHRIYSTSSTKKLMSQKKDLRAKAYAEAQRESLLSSGFNLNEDEFLLINKVFAEVNGKFDNITEIKKVYNIFVKMISLAEKNKIDYLPELKRVCYEKLMDKIYSYGLFEKLKLNFSLIKGE